MPVKYLHEEHVEGNRKVVLLQPNSCKAANAAANTYQHVAISSIQKAGLGVDPSALREIYADLVDNDKEELQK